MDTIDEQKKLALAKRQVAKIMGFYIHLAAFVLVMTLLFVANLILSPNLWLVQWPFLVWGVGLLAHGLCAFGRMPRLISNWRQRKTGGGEGRVMKATVAISAILAALIFVWYLAADRLTPYTSNVRVKGMVIDIVPKVTGEVAAVAVSNGQVVERGDLLARIDPRPFQLKVERARAALDLATQSVGAESSKVDVAVANLATARANLENVEAQTARTLELVSRGVQSRARGDNARATLAVAQSAVKAAEADLERARSELGVEGAGNAEIRDAVAALGEAELALEWAELRAPARGVIVDLDVTNGVFAREGSRLLTFVSFEEVWVEAYMTENNIANIDIGDPAEISLDLYPSLIFNGVVASISFAASDRTSSGSLPSVPRVDGWMRDPQRFPVRIAMTDYEVGSEASDIRRMINGQADVIVYTGQSRFLNALAAAWIRFMGVLSYAY